jgi:hypothetical protein
MSLRQQDYTSLSPSTNLLALMAMRSPSAETLLSFSEADLSNCTGRVSKGAWCDIMLVDALLPSLGLLELGPLSTACRIGLRESPPLR